MKKLSILLIAMTFVVSLSSASWAITFTQDTGFDSGSLVSTGDATSGNDIRWDTETGIATPGDLGTHTVVDPTSPYFNTIAWGDANNAGGENGPGVNHWGDSDFSALRVLGFSGDIVADTWTTISRVYHQNNSISGSLATLLSATIHSELTVGTTDINDLAFGFTETANSGGCAGPGGLGVCPDVFSFNAADFANVYFTEGGVDYEAEFRLANFQNSALDASGFPVLALWTEEGVTSSADVELRIHAVPEPMSMLLFSTGLAGAALRRRFIG